MPRAALLALLVALPGPGWAGQAPEQPPQAAPDERNPFLQGVRVYLGRTEAREEAGAFEDPSGDGTVAVEFGNRLTRGSRALGYDTGVWFSDRDYDNALGIAAGIDEPRLEVSWVGVTGGLRLSLPPGGPLRLHLTAGLGIFRSNLSSFGPGVIGETEDYDTGAGAYGGAALDYVVGRYAFGLDLRRLYLPADFEKAGIEDADVGGVFAGLTLRRAF